MQTSMSKDPHGWSAETTVDIAQGKHLTIRTRRGRGGILTEAKGYHQSSSGAWSHTMVIGVASYADASEGDYYKLLDHHDGRVTEPRVRAQHEATLVRIEAIKAEAVAHYRSREHLHADA